MVTFRSGGENVLKVLRLKVANCLGFSRTVLEMILVVLFTIPVYILLINRHTKEKAAFLGSLFDNYFSGVIQRYVYCTKVLFEMATKAHSSLRETTSVSTNSPSTPNSRYLYNKPQN